MTDHRLQLKLTRQQTDLLITALSHWGRVAVLPDNDTSVPRLFNYLTQRYLRFWQAPPDILTFMASARLNLCPVCQHTMTEHDQDGCHITTDHTMKPWECGCAYTPDDFTRSGGAVEGVIRSLE